MPWFIEHELHEDREILVLNDRTSSRSPRNSFLFIHCGFKNSYVSDHCFCKKAKLPCSDMCNPALIRDNYEENRAKCETDLGTRRRKLLVLNSSYKSKYVAGRNFLEIREIWKALSPGEERKTLLRYLNLQVKALLGARIWGHGPYGPRRCVLVEFVYYFYPSGS